MTVVTTKETVMSQKQMNKWIDEANALTDDEVRSPNAPVPVVLAEATQAAQVVEKYWKATAERPGFEVAADFMPQSIADEVVGLVEACQTAHSRGIFVEKTDATSKTVSKARKVAGRLAAALEFVLDDGKATQSDDALAVIKAREASNGTVAQLTQSLVDFATLAEREEVALKKLKDFDVDMIGEAKKLAKELMPGAAGSGRAASEAIRLRDRLLVLLARRVSQIRRATRYVFRDHAGIQKLATSRYERKQRAARRKSNGTATPAEESAPIA
jgi:hypothetical protein